MFTFQSQQLHLHILFIDDSLWRIHVQLQRQKLCFQFIMAVMMVPGQVSACGFLRLMMRMHMMDNLAALYIPAIASPVVFFLCIRLWNQRSPYSIVEAARVDVKLQRISYIQCHSPSGWWNLQLPFRLFSHLSVLFTFLKIQLLMIIQKVKSSKRPAINRHFLHYWYR